MPKQKIPNYIFGHAGANDQLYMMSIKRDAVAVVKKILPEQVEIYKQSYPVHLVSERPFKGFYYFFGYKRGEPSSHDQNALPFKLHAYFESQWKEEIDLLPGQTADVLFQSPDGNYHTAKAFNNGGATQVETPHQIERIKIID